MSGLRFIEVNRQRAGASPKRGTITKVRSAAGTVLATAGNVFTDMLSLVAPGIANRMHGARAAYMHRRGYEAGMTNRLSGNRKTTVSDADSALDGKQQRLRSISRDEERNNPFVAGAKRTHRQNVVGDAYVGPGITVEAAVKFPNGEPDEEVNDLLNDLWHDHQRFLDAHGMWEFQDLARLADSCLMDPGEVLGVFHPRRVWKGKHRAKVPLAIELLESDRLPMNSETLGILNQATYEVTVYVVDDHGAEREERMFVRHGIAYDKDEQIAGYFILEGHPGDAWTYSGKLRAKFWESDRVVHYFDPDRAEQTRGVIRFAPGIQTFADMRQLYMWELVAAMAQASYAVHFKGPAVEQPTYADGGQQSANLTDAYGNPVTTMQAGQFIYGEHDVNMLQNNRPGNTFEPFVKWLTRAGAASIGMGYSALARDYSGGSFSSLRQEALEERRGYRMDQGLMARHFVRRVWWEFVEGVAIAGLLPRGRFASYLADPLRFQRCNIGVPGWEYVNPLQEVRADAIAAAFGFKDLDEIPSVSGKSSEERLRRMAKLKEFAAGLDLMMPWMFGDSKPPGNVGTGEGTDNDGDSVGVSAGSEAAA